MRGMIIGKTNNSTYPALSTAQIPKLCSKNTVFHQFDLQYSGTIPYKLNKHISLYHLYSIKPIYNVAELYSENKLYYLYSYTEAGWM